jgi:hypothetical protein
MDGSRARSRTTARAERWLTQWHWSSLKNLDRPGLNIVLAVNGYRTKVHDRSNLRSNDCDPKYKKRKSAKENEKIAGSQDDTKIDTERQHGTSGIDVEDSTEQA